MANVTLGKRPESFKHPVKFPMLDGTVGEITITFKYRTRTEYGQFIDKVMADAGIENRKGQEKLSLEALMKQSNNNSADHLMQVILDWDLEVPLSRDAVKQLSDEQPAAAAEIMETYRVACNEGRLGN